jgi:ubiquinol-cytochrome c reductase cytochrome c subunit
MHHRRLSAPLAAIAVIFLYGSASALAASAEHGKTIFMQEGCWECHGTMGQGASTGPRLAPNPIPYPALAKIVRTPPRAMPPYREKILSDADLADIYAYLQTIPKPPDVKAIPLLNQWAAKPK